jgi:hypothetical protein
LAGGTGRLWAAELFFCEENPLLNDFDVPEYEAGRASAGTLPAKARQTIKSSADRSDFMMSFHKEVE